MDPVIRHAGRGSLGTRAIYALAVAGSPDIALVSPGTTFGWRRGDEWLARHIRAAGATCEVVPVALGRAAAMRRTMALTDVVEALAARRAAHGITAGATIYSSITAALLQPTRQPSAIRFDGIAAVNRPGLGGVWQRRREPAVLARADLLLPWGQGGAEQAREVLAAFGERATETIVLSPPVETASPAPDAPDVLAYAANPDKRGLELLCRVWSEVRPEDGRLALGGLDRDEGLRWLRRSGVPEPAGVEWLGTVERERWLSLVAGARAFLSAAQIEDWGLAQMEALAIGTPLVMVAAPGANAALPLARQLWPDLVASRRTVSALASVLETALRLDGPARAAYAVSARELLAPYSEPEIRRRVAELVLPRLLRSSE